MVTLLEKAKSITFHKPFSADGITDEQIELAIAWAKGEIAHRQLVFALEKEMSRGSVFNFVNVCLREALRRGILIEKH